MSVATEQLRFINLKKQAWIWQGHKIQYAVMGTGKPLVLVHGFGASIGHWCKNIPVLANAGYKVYAVDLLGFGGSDKALLNYSVEIWVELLKDFWTAHIQKPAVFIGNSLGAFISLVLVTEHPEISAGGILINSAGGLSPRPHELNPLLQIIMATFNQVVQFPITSQFIFNYIRQKSVIRHLLYQIYRDRSVVTDELVDLFYIPACDPRTQQVITSILTAPPGSSPTKLLAKLKLPLLVIWGADDPLTPITGAKIYQQASANGKNIKITSIPHAGHCPHYEVPDIVNAKIINWLAKV